MPAFRWGYNINGNRVGDANYFLQHMSQISPAWTLIMSNTELAEATLDRTDGKTNVIDRAYSPKEGTQWRTMSPSSYAAELMAGNRKHLWHYVLNEPNTPNDLKDISRRNEWIADVIEIMTDSGFKVVAGNFAAGSYENWHIDQGAYDRLLKVLSERKEVAKLGIHEYTAIALPFGGGVWDQWDMLEREKVQQQYWPTLDHSNPDYRIGDYTTRYVPHLYHLFRSHWFQMRVINALNMPPLEFVITEYGWDRMPDMTQGQNHIYDALKKRYGINPPFQNLRGPYTHAKLWKYYWGHWSTSEAIFHQFKWSEENYNEWYVGFLPFMWSFGDNWDNIDGFNYGADHELHSLMTTWSQTFDREQPSEPPTPTPPDPTTPVPPIGGFEIVEDESNILTNPTLDGFRLQATVGDRIIESPPSWMWVYESLEGDADLIPSVFHRSPGMGVSGGYIKWQGGFEQEGVKFVKGQRFLSRGIVENNFRFVGDGQYPTDIAFRFVVTNDDGLQESSTWMNFDGNWQNRQTEMLWVFETTKSFIGKFRFECWTKWANTDGETKFVVIALQRMASGYRDDVVQYVGEIDDIPEPPDPIPEPPVPDPVPIPEEIDMLEYLRGDGRLYDLRFEFPGGPGEGIQTVQTHSEGRRFFHVKGYIGWDSQWEELWYDNDFIYRGTDVSPSMTELYQVREGGEYGQKWIPRFAKVGDKHLAIPEVTFRNRSDGSNVDGKPPYLFPHWIEVKKIHSSYTFKGGIVLNNVAELWGYLHDPHNNRPGQNFEQYFYAMGYGLVGWRDPLKNWVSYIVHEHQSGSLNRLTIDWLTLPSLPPIEDDPQQPATFPLSDDRWAEIWLSSTDLVWGTNVRQQPSTRSPVVGSVKKDKPALILREERRSKPDGSWYPFRLNSVASDGFDDGDFSNSGWVRQDVMTYRERVVTPPPEPPELMPIVGITIKYDPNNEMHNLIMVAIDRLVSAIEMAGAEVDLEERDE